MVIRMRSGAGITIFAESFFTDQNVGHAVISSPISVSNFHNANEF